MLVDRKRLSFRDLFIFPLRLALLQADSLNNRFLLSLVQIGVRIDPRFHLSTSTLDRHLRIRKVISRLLTSSVFLPFWRFVLRWTLKMLKWIFVKIFFFLLSFLSYRLLLNFRNIFCVWYVSEKRGVLIELLLRSGLIHRSWACKIWVLELLTNLMISWIYLSVFYARLGYISFFNNGGILRSLNILSRIVMSSFLHLSLFNY